MRVLLYVLILALATGLIFYATKEKKQSIYDDGLLESSQNKQLMVLGGKLDATSKDLALCQSDLTALYVQFEGELEGLRYQVSQQKATSGNAYCTQQVVGDAVVFTCRGWP